VHELHTSLCKMSLEYVQASEDAFNKGLYNASDLMSQISAELTIKATIAFLGY
jgi:HEPN domain-containing protein